MAAGTEEDPSVRHWLKFHEQNERFDPGYRTSFSIDELDAAVRCHDDHGFAVIENVLSPEQVAAFRTDITASVHPPGELPEAARLALQPSIETIASQQRLLEHPRWMAVQRRLLDLAADDPGEGLTCHHSACLVRTKGNSSVRWHTDFHPVATRGQGWLNRSETRRGHGMWFYLNGSHPRAGGLCVIENSHRPDWRPPRGFAFAPGRKTFHRIGESEEEIRSGYPSFDVDGCVPLVTNPGDLIIFAPRTFHGAFPVPRGFNDVRHSANFGLRQQPFMTGASADCPLLAPWARSLQAAQLEDALPDHLKRFARLYPGSPAGPRQPAARL